MVIPQLVAIRAGILDLPLQLHISLVPVLKARTTSRHSPKVSTPPMARHSHKGNMVLSNRMADPQLQHLDMVQHLLLHSNINTELLLNNTSKHLLEVFSTKIPMEATSHNHSNFHHRHQATSLAIHTVALHSKEVMAATLRLLMANSHHLHNNKDLTADLQVDMVDNSRGGNCNRKILFFCFAPKA
jgi:hypothetical protein